MDGRVVEIRALDAEARMHKRKAQQHREAARLCRQRQAALEAECRRLGIEVVHHSAGDTHGETRRTAP